MRYCIGDIHGCIKTLDKLVTEIYKQDQNPEFYFVGDLIDRGPDSKAVIDFIIDLKANNNTQIVLGNHEVMLLNSYKNNLKISDSIWQQNGAAKTLLSFNPNANLTLPANNFIPKKYYSFIETLPFYIELKDYFIVHAGFNFNINEPFTDFESMVWIREEQYNSEFTKGKKIIHGHTTISVEQISKRLKSQDLNNINIDSGCVYLQYNNLGNLSALNMDELKLISVKNIDMV